jgi:hypothetical protein
MDREARMSHWTGRLALLAVATLAGCVSTDTVETFQAPERDVASLRSYYWRDGEFGLPLVQDPAVIDDARRKLRETVDTELRAKGYVLAADAASADFLVSYNVAAQRRYASSDTTRVGSPSPNEVLMPGEIQPPPASMGAREVTVREGTVAIYADDRATGKLLWRGSVDIEQRIASSEAGVRLVHRLAHEITREFPPRAGGG